MSKHSDDCAGRNVAPTKLYWKDTEGGMGGAHDVLMANDDKYVGHFYVDADDSVDVEAVLRLIAAAPELLEALKVVAGGDNWRCFKDEEWDIVNAAIAKAEGRSDV